MEWWKSGPCRSCIFGAYFAYLVKENAGGKAASMPRKRKKSSMRSRAHLLEGLKESRRRRNFSFLVEEREGRLGQSKAKRRNTCFWISARQTTHNVLTNTIKPCLSLSGYQAKGTFWWWYCCCCCYCCSCVGCGICGRLLFKC